MEEREPSVIRENHCYVTKITLNAPEKGNVVNADNLPLIVEYMKEAIQSDQCRVIVLQGKEGVFSRGMDFNNLMNTTRDSSVKQEFSEPYKEAVKLIRNSPKPVVAKVDGDVLAGGMGLLLACDIIIATKKSIFGLSEVLFGIIPAYVFPFLLERVSYKRARYLVLASRRFGADEAYNYGIVDELVEDGTVEKALKNCLKRLLYSSPDALALTKRYSDELTDNKIDEAVDFAQKQLTELLNNPENIETIKSFLEGEKPKWAVSYKSKK